MSIESFLTEEELLATPGSGDPVLRRLSQSSLAKFARCPEQFRVQNLLGLYEPPSEALIWGSADDAAASHNFEQKILSGEDLPVDEVQDAFRDAVTDGIEEAGGISEVRWDSSPIEVVDQGARLVWAYHKQVAPTVQPVTVQEWFELDVPGVGLPVVGRIDATTDHATIEGKTAKAKKSRPEPHWRLQGGIYQLHTGKPVEWHVRTKTKTPAVYTPDNEPGLRETFPDRMTETRVRVYYEQIMGFLERLGPYEPWPSSAPDYGWACLSCWQRPSCPWWNA